MQGGSGVKDGRRGGSPWLHKRGFGSAEAREGPRRTPEGILDGAGDSPPFSRQGAVGASSVQQDRSEAQPGVTRSALMPRRPSFCEDSGFHPEKVLDVDPLG